MFYSDFWLPFSMMDTLAQVGMGGDRLHDRGGQWLLAAGRLRDGVSAQAAAAELEVIGKRLSAAYPATNDDRSFHVELAGQINPGIRKMVVVFFLMLICVAIMVLCTACANVANLLLARASARQKEIATRLAIGAGRGRLVRQLLTESLMLALLGGIARIRHRAAGRQRDRQIPNPARLAGRLFGLARLPGHALLHRSVRVHRSGVRAGSGITRDAAEPDWRAQGRTRIDSANRAASACAISWLWRRWRSAWCCWSVPDCFCAASIRPVTSTPGFTHRNLLLMAFDPSLNRYAPAETRRLVDRILEAARAVPGVEAASLGDSVPLNIEGTQNSFTPEGHVADGEKGSIRADIYSVAPQYFETFGIRMLDGEDFRPGGSPDDIVIVNQAASDKAFPNQNPIGRRISYLGRKVRIAGLVATTKSRTIGEDPHPCLYFPMARDPRGNDSLTGMTLVLRTRGNPAGYAPLVRLAIRNIDPALAVFDVRTMDTQLAQALFLPRATALLFGLAGLMGLLISTVGIYGVVSFSVARQTREIGVRMAMGARRGQVLGMVLKQGLILTVIGSAIGLGLAMALGRMASSLLYGVSPTDTLTFILVPALLLLVALVACLVPARRAASLDPIHALRYE